MPLPLVIPIAIGLAGAFGIGKTVVAISDSNAADRIDSNARDVVNLSQEELEEKRKTSNKTLEDLGKKKYDTIAKNLKDFVETFGQLKHTELLLDKDLKEFGLTDFDSNAFKEIQNDISILESSAMGLGVGALGGGMAAFGAYSGTMMLASAGTGTAIGSLSGVAATNATLAWLGGGTLASGGLGVAGGTMVLGTLVAGPALLILGTVLGAKANKKLNDAKSNLELAKEFKAQADSTWTKLKGIEDMATLVSDTMSTLRSKCRRHVKLLQVIINETGNDYREYSREQKESVVKTVTYAQLLKLLVDTPILDENGNLLGDAEANVKRCELLIEA